LPINLEKKKSLDSYFPRKNSFALQIEKIREKENFLIERKKLDVSNNVS